MPAGPATVCHLLSARAASHGQREFLRFGDRRLTFAGAHDASNRLARVLRDLGVQAGDRIALVLPNGLTYPVAWLAVAGLGAVVVPVNVQYRRSDLAFVLRDSKARLAIAGPEQAPLVESVRATCPGLGAVAELREDAAAAQPTPFIDLRSAMERAGGTSPLDPGTADRLVTIQYTSGTTGFPKGCLLTHEYWLTLAQAMQSHVRLGDGDTVLTAQPFSYMDPTWNVVLCLLAGTPLVILPRFSASTFWRSVCQNDVTFFYCLGTMPVRMAKQPVDPAVERGHRVRLVYCSGIPAALHASFEERWGCPWREAYGTTELGCVLMTPPDSAATVGSGSMGWPVPGREVRVADEHGSPAGEGTVGELLVRGPGMMLGYHGHSAATKAWRPDGWARTGDLVIHSPSGYRHVGRLRDMIRRGGENIAAAEVEAILCQHPAVLAAACLPVPDEIRGEEVKAFVQLRPEAGAVPPQALLDFVAERVAQFKVPRYLEFVESFPLTPSERIAKAELLANRSDHGAGTYDAMIGR